MTITYDPHQTIVTYSGIEISGGLADSGITITPNDDLVKYVPGFNATEGVIVKSSDLSGEVSLTYQHGSRSSRMLAYLVGQSTLIGATPVKATLQIINSTDSVAYRLYDAFVSKRPEKSYTADGTQTETWTFISPNMVLFPEGDDTGISNTIDGIMDISRGIGTLV